MIAELNTLIDIVESNLSAESAESVEVGALAKRLGTTEYHLRRMFSSLAGIPLSDYVRRRRMTVAAGDIIGGEDLLSVAVRYGYGSTEAFTRAFRILPIRTPQIKLGLPASRGHVNHVTQPA